MDRHERALIDTGEAMPSRKQLQAYTPKMSGPIGLARSQFLISIFHHHYYCNTSGVASFLKSREYQKYSSSSGSIALSKIYDPIILVIREISRNGSIKPTTCI